MFYFILVVHQEANHLRIVVLVVTSQGEGIREISEKI